MPNFMRDCDEVKLPTHANLHPPGLSLTKFVFPQWFHSLCE
jgi:hypothetical protein